MKQLTKIFTILIVLCMVFSMVACNNGNNEATPTPDNGGTTTPDNSGTTTPNNSGSSAKDTLSVVVTQDRGTLDPMFLGGYEIAYGVQMIYEPLWRNDAEGNPIWCLATGVEYISPTVWRITLREGVTFSNGNAFNAEDAMFCFERGNNRGGEPPYFAQLDLESSSIIDEYTIELVFFLHDFSYVYSVGGLPMMDKESFNEDTVATTPIGTGPYVMTNYVINSHLDMTVRDDYWGEQGKIKNLHFMVLAEDAQRVNAIQTGTADIAGIPYQDVEFVESLSGITVTLDPAASNNCIYFNVSENSIFYDNVDARMAVSLAIDCQGIIDIVFNGYATIPGLPASRHNIDAEESMFDQGVYQYGYDPELAKEYAERGGLLEDGVEIRLIAPAMSHANTTCELIQENLRAIGVSCSILNCDAGSWLSTVFDPTTFDMCLSATFTASRTMANNFYSWTLYMYGCAYSGNPWPGHDRYMELVTDIMSVSDAAELRARCLELNEIHTDAVLWFAYADLLNPTAYNSDLQGYVPLFAYNVDYSKLSWPA